MRYKACTIYWLVGKKYQMHEKKYTDSLNEGPTQQQVMSQLVITSEVKCYSVFTWASSTLIILFSEMSTFSKIRVFFSEKNSEDFIKINMMRNLRIYHLSKLNPQNK